MSLPFHFVLPKWICIFDTRVHLLLRPHMIVAVNAHCSAEIHLVEYEPLLELLLCVDR